MTAKPRPSSLKQKCFVEAKDSPVTRKNDESGATLVQDTGSVSLGKGVAPKTAKDSTVAIFGSAPCQKNTASIENVQNGCVL